MVTTSHRWVAATATAVLGVTLTACTGDQSGGTVSPRSVAAAAAVTDCGTYSGTGCAPTADRVDVTMPTFSDPTKIDNPLFPISRLHSAVLLGEVDSQPFRSETTLLPGSASVTWNGKRIEVVLSQYTAYSGGRIEEVALDRYAQADDGSVWYFGEDVFDYVNGTIRVTEGTWLAGSDGPPAMIMAAGPKAGEVFRPENITGVVFEEVRVKKVDQTVDGPRGKVSGAIVAEELHLDGSTSDKVFAPGYGEFFSGHEGDTEALAVAVPIDAVTGPAPRELDTLSTSAMGILENVRLEDWEAAVATVRRMQGAWTTLRSQQPPPLVAARLTSSLAALDASVQAEKVRPSAQAALDLAQSALDLELRFRPRVEIDLERFRLHAQQLRVHAAAKDAGGVAGEVALLGWIRDRVVGALPAAGLSELDAGLREMRGASDAGNLPATADHAARLAAWLLRAAGSTAERWLDQPSPARSCLLLGCGVTG